MQSMPTYHPKLEPQTAAQDLAAGLSGLREELNQFMNDIRQQLHCHTSHEARPVLTAHDEMPRGLDDTEPDYSSGQADSSNPIERLQHIKQQLAARLGRT